MFPENAEFRGLVKEKNLEGVGKAALARPIGESRSRTQRDEDIPTKGGSSQVADQ